MTVLFGLFVSALLAATLLPLQSEAVLVGLIAGGAHDPVLLVAVASAGNVLGALVNWLLGRGIARFRGRQWFPVSDKALERAERHYARWGFWSLLFSWAPVIGDPLTLVAGMLREPLWRFLLLVSIGKVARYAVLAAVTLGAMG